MAECAQLAHECERLAILLNSLEESSTPVGLVVGALTHGVGDFVVVLHEAQTVFKVNQLV